MAPFKTYICVFKTSKYLHFEEGYGHLKSFFMIWQVHVSALKFVEWQKCKIKWKQNNRWFDDEHINVVTAVYYSWVHDTVHHTSLILPHILIPAWPYITCVTYTCVSSILLQCVPNIISVPLYYSCVCTLYYSCVWPLYYQCSPILLLCGPYIIPVWPLYYSYVAPILLLHGPYITPMCVPIIIPRWPQYYSSVIPVCALYYSCVTPFCPLYYSCMAPILFLCVCPYITPMWPLYSMLFLCAPYITPT